MPISRAKGLMTYYKTHNNFVTHNYNTTINPLHCHVYTLSHLLGLCLIKTQSQPRRFVDGLSSQTPVFSPKVDSVGFVVNRRALGQHDCAC